MIATLAAATILSLTSTSYCLTGTMADGTQTRPRSVAMNTLPLGSKIKLIKPRSFNGYRIFYVRDRIGYGSELDFWAPSCGQSMSWGRRPVTIKVLRTGRG